MSITPSQAELDRRTRLDLKRRLKLAGFESDLTEISNITVLRQLLVRQVPYKEGQQVEVEFENPNVWRKGEFLQFNHIYFENQNQESERICVLLSGETTPQTLEDLRHGSHPQSANQKLYEAAVEARQQRDEMANALEAVWRQWKTATNPVVGGRVYDVVKAALVKAGRQAS